MLPMTIPERATMATPLNGAAPDAKTIVVTGRTPLATAAATYGQHLSTPVRLAVVKTATPNMTATTASDPQTSVRAHDKTNATMASWTTARAAATASSRPVPRRPIAAAP